MFILCTLLAISFASVVIVIFFDLSGRIEMPSELLIGLLGFVTAQIVSVLILFVKFINDVKTLTMHEAVTHKLLEYLAKSQSQDQADDER